MTSEDLTPAQVAAFDQQWRTINRTLDGLLDAYRNVTSDGQVSREADLVLFATALPENVEAQSMGALLACAVARLAAPDPETEIKRLDDGWAWRCWTCGWHGSGLVSEEGARHELADHDCQEATP